MLLNLSTRCGYTESLLHKVNYAVLERLHLCSNNVIIIIIIVIVIIIIIIIIIIITMMNFCSSFSAKWLFIQIELEFTSADFC